MLIVFCTFKKFALTDTKPTSTVSLQRPPEYRQASVRTGGHNDEHGAIA
jgi:hypothetical protein